MAVIAVFVTAGIVVILIRGWYGSDAAPIEEGKASPSGDAPRPESGSPTPDPLAAPSLLPQTPVLSRGRELEISYRKLAASHGDPKALEDEARAAADALLDEGELRRAAFLYHDAGLTDHAIHLYVNVLGEPELAAPIVARNGDLERAAELYELAGDRKRAATTWVELASNTRDPALMIDRIAELSLEVALDYLDGETRRRSVGDSAELFYQHAGLLARHGDTDRALEVYRRLVTELGRFKDVASRIERLEAGLPLPEIEHVEPPALPALEISVEPDEIRALAEQVARATAARFNNPELELARLVGEAATPLAAKRMAVGLEGNATKLPLLHDAAVIAARGGPSAESLIRSIQQRPCDLQTIEQYYRLGLAHQVAGRFDQAVAAYERVDNTSPGYRDAGKRAQTIRDWQKALGKRAEIGLAPRGEARYQIRGELGRGGISVVYRAKDIVLGRDVALKFVSAALTTDPEIRDLFDREARAFRLLRHPNVVAIHDVGTLEGRAYLAMELVDGRALETLRLQPGGLSIVETLRATKQVLDALGYAHQREIIHRGIEPSSVMRTASGLIKVMDFGLARLIEGGSRQSSIAGTPELRSPEQLRAEDVDHRTDLFSVGATLYTLLTNRFPFHGTDRLTPPRPVSDVVPIPDLIEQMIAQSLAIDPEARPESAFVMARPIAQVLDAVSRVSGEHRFEPAAAAAGIRDAEHRVVLRFK